MVRFTVNISQDLDDWLATQADLHNRSKSKHVAYLLEYIKKQSDIERCSDLAMDALDDFERAIREDEALKWQGALK